MTSLLETTVRQHIAAGFAGRLLRGTLRRVAKSSLDSSGDVVAGAVSTFTFEGIRDTFSLQFAQTAGVPVTDAKILFILGLIKPQTDPRQDDQVKIRNEWFQLRKMVSVDPAEASQEWAGFKIKDPT